tara:strand:- start:2959 stop:3228 length:270 start_codon:yes stop_codon:yes gene_type:complete
MKAIYETWCSQGRSKAHWFGGRFDPTLDQLHEIRTALEAGLQPESPEGVSFFSEAGKRWFDWAQEDYPEDSTTVEQWAEIIKHYGAVLA